MEHKKLYKVILRGMNNCSTGISYGSSFVVAKNPHEAYEKVRDFLDTNDYGFRKDRELDRVELIADNNPHTDLGTLLFI